ncbi:hypothetical protein [Endozoicomonas sp. ONNA2]|uniref:hypothetical protein n=1 Tax=Endozoicomonas sp. ONNA2 TaxID=2828741 RepID=UPI002149753B|nr:hypothetical protein [Endozoicomonas sp. ONNA2]
MIVLFVSECERQAVRKSRRILNRYARQIGRRSWLARLSKEGIDDVHAALRSVSSRQMAVACHRISSRTRTELLWVVGSRRHFDHDGNYAFSSSSQDFLRPPRESSPMERLVAYLAELAGLFHDLGKDNAFFQGKLWRAIQKENSKALADPVRHELLSVMLAGKLAALASGVRHTKKAEDSLWLKVFSHLPALSQLFSEQSELFKPDGSWNVSGKQEPDSPFPLPKCKDNNVLLWAWLWILGSHHRLPFGKYQDAGNEAPSLTRCSHVRCAPEDPDYSNQLNLNLRPADSASRPWQQDARWLARVSRCTERIRHWLVNHQTQMSDPVWRDAFIRTITHFGRTGMMCADHSVSANDNAKPSNAVTGTLIANTARGGPGSVLGTHLFNVGRQARSLSRVLWQQHLGLPFIAKEDIPPPMLPISSEPANSAFAWQDAACKVLKDVAKAGSDSGFIGFVQAGTGFGKTRACARIMATCSSEVRYTVALGLRTLTLQTGQSYRNELELSRQQGIV